MTEEKAKLFKNLAERFASDKRSHGYIDHYAEYLPDRVRLMLEIGVEHGRSAELWDSIYGNDELDLHLIDLFINPDFVSARWCRNRGFVPHAGDQGDANFLYTIRPQFEVLIDDGAHRADLMIISWKHLFLNNLQRGGIYVIEDTHCNLDPFYYGGYVKMFAQTPLAMFTEYLRTGKLDNPYLLGAEAETFEALISRVEIKDEKIIFIWKK